MKFLARRSLFHVLQQDYVNNSLFHVLQRDYVNNLKSINLKLWQQASKAMYKYIICDIGSLIFGILF